MALQLRARSPTRRFAGSLVRPRPLQALVRPHPTHQGIAFWILERFDGQVHIDRWPAEMVCTWPANINELLHSGLGKPWEVAKRHEDLPAVEQQPEAVRRDVRDFSFQNALSRRGGFHRRAPEHSAARQPGAAWRVPNSAPTRPLGPARTWLLLTATGAASGTLLTGAFTGALTKRSGRYARADRSGDPQRVGGKDRQIGRLASLARTEDQQPAIA